ncbi:Anthranilate synthase, phenazine specific (Includes: Glutamine amidotransferase) [Magnetospirillum molischianum DSM 120]|uniref:anthranilate synthase n=2 Tax=Magnetospirillum molischianum TaxID=1083 RepID=H8FWA6_MAGML|nr:Anthranilate synthase, phenazine specific (Includes: Glutamine amidotransferase) [Magnetospirillum molischianum DSM 120]
MKETSDVLLRRILSESPQPFALLYRAEENSGGMIDVIVGKMAEPSSLVDLPLPGPSHGGPHHELLVVIPYRQIVERGFDVVDDGAPLLALEIIDQDLINLNDALNLLPNDKINITGEHFDLDDQDYTSIAKDVICKEIGSGEGSNFVIKRTFMAEIEGYTLTNALSFFRCLLNAERGAYWTFIIHTGTRTFVGASPERHISVQENLAVMNPISGTYRYPPSGPNLNEVMEFLENQKESNELYMVVDEELKMMSRLCEDGGRVLGPHLKEMSHLAHTEYLIEGLTYRDVRDILRETLFAPTVTGSPLESACRVIRRYEPQGRAYYSGVAALIGRDIAGGRSLDSAILIRTADISATGQMRIAVGSTIVRDSDPMSEAAETRAKAMGLIAALKCQSRARFATHPRVLSALESRNAPISSFWLSGPKERQRTEDDLYGCKAIIVDAEDSFTMMFAKQLQSLGLIVDVRSFREKLSFDDNDLVIMGPGPGDPTDIGHPKISFLHRTIRSLLSDRRPFLAVCLSHQVLSLCLGLDLQRRKVPNQGVQKSIGLFGAEENVGFYNTFAAQSGRDFLENDNIGVVDISRDQNTGEVHALRGPGFASIQFHPESVLTQDGPRIIAALLRHALTYKTFREKGKVDAPLYCD